MPLSKVFAVPNKTENLKSNLNLEQVRCRSPEMVRRELWMTVLAYNLIRSTAAVAALLHALNQRRLTSHRPYNKAFLQASRQLDF